MASLACPAPEILIARLGAETQRIRIGSGGVMLPHYSPFKVAELFAMLSALYPGRIDLGLGRAPGGGPLESFALRRDRKEGAIADDFGDQLLELLAFLDKRFSCKSRFQPDPVTPQHVDRGRRVAAGIEPVEFIGSRTAGSLLCVRAFLQWRIHSRSDRTLLRPLSALEVSRAARGNGGSRSHLRRDTAGGRASGVERPSVATPLAPGHAGTCRIT